MRALVSALAAFGGSAFFVGACADDTKVNDAPLLVDAGGTVDAALLEDGSVMPPVQDTPDAASNTAPALDAAPVDPTFSFVVMPDTQLEVTNDASSAKYFTNRVAWIDSTWASSDLRFVLHTGDAANWGNVDPVQFDRISTAFQAFDALHHRYAIAPGNHDTAAVCTGGSACPGQNTLVTVRDTAAFNKRFPPSRMPWLSGTFEPTKSDNAFYETHEGGLNWLVITLELWPRTVVVDWAKTVVENHPKYNVIFATHMNIDGAGSISTSNGGYGANSPKYVYDNLYGKYENVRFVFSGHVGQSAFKETIGEKGNKIFHLLNCFHSNTDNPTRVVDVDTAKNTFATHVYAPSSNVTYPNATYAGSNAAWIRP